MTKLVADSITIRRGPCPVVDAVSLELVPGRVLAIVGPNGAGKSTLLTALAGLLPLHSGRIVLDGTALHHMPAQTRAQRIGFLPQVPELHWGLLVEDVVALGRLPHRGRHGGWTAADTDAVAHAVAAADIGHLAGRRSDRLSGGERARVLAARLIAGQPAVILADEPLANLDPRHQQAMLALFRRLADAGAAVALVLHDLTAALRVADDAVLMDAGRAVAQGPCSEVLVPHRLSILFQCEIRHVETADGPALLPGAALRY